MDDLLQHPDSSFTLGFRELTRFLVSWRGEEADCLQRAPKDDSSVSLLLILSMSLYHFVPTSRSSLELPIFLRATAGLNINLTQITQLGELWKVAEFGDIITALEKNVSDANAGALYGNRMFWSNDYMVGRFRCSSDPC
jgi:hypothetical protein